MDFIERVFGVSIDGGSGTAEVAIVVAALALIALFARRLRLRR